MSRCHRPATASAVSPSAGGGPEKPQERADQDGTRVQQMLAVVQDQQSLPAGQAVRQRGHSPAGRLVKEAERPGDLRGEQAGIPQPRQLRHPGPVPEGAAQLGRRLHSQPCLTDPARAGQRDQPRAGQHGPDTAKLGPPPDEPAQLSADTAARPG
jgi:hypothetical protein